MNLNQLLQNFVDSARENDEPYAAEIRLKNQLCPTCDGDGTVGPGFVYTQADRDEWDPDDFREHMEDIRRGVYDRPCGTCNGNKVIKVLSPDSPPAALHAWELWQQESYDTERIYDMERRMGA